MYQIMVSNKSYFFPGMNRGDQCRDPWVMYVGQSASTSSTSTTTYSYKSERALVRLLHGWEEFILHPYGEGLGERNDMAHPLRLIKV